MKISDITEDQLAKDWTLSENDIEFILSNSRTDINLIRTAVQLCVLRKTAGFATRHSNIALKAVNYLAHQLMQPSLLKPPDLEWSKSDYPRFAKIQAYLNYKEFDESEKQALANWLVEEAQNILDRKELTAKAKEYLQSRRIVLPAPTSFGRFIASSIKNAHLGLYRQITGCFPKQDLQKLDALLTGSDNSLYTQLMDFKRPPPEPNAKIINQFLSYFEILEKLDITRCDLSYINPQVIESLAQLARSQSSWNLRRIKPDEKRYAILICFLAESVKTILDTIIDMHGLLLGDIERRSKNEFKAQRISMVGNAKTSRKRTLDFVKKALAYETPDKTTLADFLASFNRNELVSAVKEVEEYEDFEEQGVINNIVKRFSYLRKYTKEMLKLNFEAAPGTKPLLEAIKILRQYHESEGKTFSKNPPVNFLTKAWRAGLYDTKGNFQIKYWETGVYYAMRQSLNKGDLYITDSRHHRYFWDTVYKPADWQEKREESYVTLALPTEFDRVEINFRKEFEQNIRLVKENLGKDGFATIVNDNIKLCKDDALEITPEIKHLKRQIEAAMPVIRIERLIAEVDKITNFSNCFLPVRQDRLLPRKPLYGALTAQATNIGIYAMGHSNHGISAEILQRVSGNYITPENIQNSNARLIKYHQDYPITKIYGTGIYSSSDAQRYGIQSSMMMSSYYPRYYGYYDKAISIYTHISDQYSVFSTQVISCALREATYVLDGLLSNNTVLNPEFHCTDTHGYTDHLFALCYLLGFSFQPRLSDIPHQTLYKMYKTDQYGDLDCLFTGSTDLQNIREQWDTVVRIAASLKNNIAPAHVIIQRLAGRGDKVSKALASLGRLIKTIYIFRYISDPDLRRKVHLQLNRGESRHSLAKVIFFDNRGVFKTSDYEEIMNKASCLSLVSNSVLVWNTHHMQQITDRMRNEGHDIEDESLSRVSPLSLKKIIVHGMYNFEEII